MNMTLIKDIQPMEKITREYNFNYYPAGFWIRLAAFWMDALICISLAMSIWSIFSNILSINHFSIFFIFLFISYHVITIGKFGSTPGKSFFGLRVISFQAPKPSYLDALIRTLFYFFSEFFLFMGFIWIAINPYKQGWHDILANTAIIRAIRVSSLKRIIELFILTIIMVFVITVHFNTHLIYRTISSKLPSWRNLLSEEVVDVFVTEKEIMNNETKIINTRNGPYIIALPSNIKDGETYRVARDDSKGGTFYIKFVVVQRI